MSSISLNFKRLDGTVTSLEFSSYASVGSMRQTIAQRFWNLSESDESMRRVRLIYMGRVLGDDSSTLLAEGIKDSDTIHVILRDAQAARQQPPNNSSQHNNQTQHNFQHLPHPRPHHHNHHHPPRGYHINYQQHHFIPPQHAFVHPHQPSPFNIPNLMSATVAMIDPHVVHHTQPAVSTALPQANGLQQSIHPQVVSQLRGEITNNLEITSVLLRSMIQDMVGNSSASSNFLLSSASTGNLLSNQQVAPPTVTLNSTLGDFQSALSLLSVRTGFLSQQVDQGSSPNARIQRTDLLMQMEGMRVQFDRLARVSQNMADVLRYLQQPLPLTTPPTNVSASSTHTTNPATMSSTTTTPADNLPAGNQTTIDITLTEVTVDQSGEPNTLLVPPPSAAASASASAAASAAASASASNATPDQSNALSSTTTSATSSTTATSTDSGNITSNIPSESPVTTTSTATMPGPASTEAPSQQQETNANGLDISSTSSQNSIPSQAPPQDMHQQQHILQHLQHLQQMQQMQQMQQQMLHFPIPFPFPPPVPGFQLPIDPANPGQQQTTTSHLSVGQQPGQQPGTVTTWTVNLPPNTPIALTTTPPLSLFQLLLHQQLNPHLHLLLQVQLLVFQVLKVLQVFQLLRTHL